MFIMTISEECVYINSKNPQTTNKIVNHRRVSVVDLYLRASPSPRQIQCPRDLRRYPVITQHTIRCYRQTAEGIVAPPACIIAVFLKLSHFKVSP